MSIWENVKIAMFSIRTNLMRSILTMLGIIIGVASVIAIITVGNGGKDYIVSMISEMNSNSVNIQVDSSANNDEFITREDIEYIKKVDSITYASPISYKIGSASSDTGKMMCLAMSGNVDLQQVMSITILSGRFFTADEYNNSSNVCVIPEIGAMALFGTTDCVGKYVTLTLNNQNAKLKIIGVTNTDVSSTSSGSSTDRAAQVENSDASFGSMIALILPCTVTDAMSGSNGAYDMLYIMSDDESQVDSIGNAARNILYARHGNFGSDVYTIVNMETYTNLVDSIVNILTTFIAGVSAISLLVGGIGVMNIMLVSVTERTREIGIRKSLGAKTSTILLQFLTESIILCLIGGIIGFILGVSMAVAIAAYAEIPITIEFTTVAIAVGFSSGVGIFFGIYPARKAAKMLPIDALRRD